MASRVKFVTEYGTYVGNRYRRYETPDGYWVEICVRAFGRRQYTNAQAKAEAVRILARGR